MLFKVKDLKGIKSGDITLAFRRWKKPRVKNGSLIRTTVGQIEILDISTIHENEISEKEANLAGYSKRSELMEILHKREDTLYRIALRYHSPDPRIALRNTTDLSQSDLDQLNNKLQRLDRYSKSGPWTFRVLKAIRMHPQLRAVDLATKVGEEKDWLKPNVRKLKNLGLTISHGIGYSLSPLGNLILDQLNPSENQE